MNSFFPGSPQYVNTYIRVNENLYFKSADINKSDETADV